MVKEIPSPGTFRALQSVSTLSNGLVLYKGLFVLIAKLQNPACGSELRNFNTFFKIQGNGEV